MLAYGPLAAHLVARSPIELSRCDVLDAGAGTGAVGEQLAAVGARVISCDLEHDMLRADTVEDAPGIAAVADITALPFRDGVFDGGIAAFVLNHLADPVSALRELQRVTRDGGFVMASVFAAARDPAKDAIDAVLAAHGWHAPIWYQAMRERAEALATPERMAVAARRVGFTEVEADCTAVDVGLDDPSLVVRYRFGMPQVVVYVDAITAPERAALVAAATAAVAQTGERFRPTVIELVARVNRGAAPRRG
jgi:ubiquinone/menaquinone biosynthesis C-methylase UbiE